MYRHPFLLKCRVWPFRTDISWDNRQDVVAVIRIYGLLWETEWPGLKLKLIVYNLIAVYYVRHQVNRYPYIGR